MTRSSSRTARLVSLVLLAALGGLPASAAPKGRNVDADALTHLSQSAAIRYWLGHPNRAPDQLKEVFQRATGAVPRANAARAPAAPFSVSDVLTGDFLGLPQNEESVSACRLDDSLVIEGTNDYRGLLDAEGNFTGWHLSTDGGSSLAKEGLLPAVTDPVAVTRPSGGEPELRSGRSVRQHERDRDLQDGRVHLAVIGVRSGTAVRPRRRGLLADASLRGLLGRSHALLRQGVVRRRRHGRRRARLGDLQRFRLRPDAAEPRGLHRRDLRGAVRRRSDQLHGPHPDQQRRGCPVLRRDDRTGPADLPHVGADRRRAYGGPTDLHDQDARGRAGNDGLRPGAGRLRGGPGHPVRRLHTRERLPGGHLSQARGSGPWWHLPQGVRGVGRVRVPGPGHGLRGADHLAVVLG